VPQAGAAAAWRGVLWSRAEALAEGIQRGALASWNLAYVLASERHSERHSKRRGGAGGVGADGKAGGCSDARSVYPFVAALAEAFAAEDTRAAAAGVAKSSGATLHAAYLQSAGLGSTLAAAANGGFPFTPYSAADAFASVLGDEHGSQQLPLRRGFLHPCVRLLARFWIGVTKALRDAVDGLCDPANSNASFVRQSLTDAYPRLHHTLLDAVARTARSVALRSTAPAPGPAAAASASASSSSAAGIAGGLLFALGCGHRRLLWSVAPLLSAFLARSVARLGDAVEGMFPGVKPGAGKAGKAQQWGEAGRTGRNAAAAPPGDAAVAAAAASRDGFVPTAAFDAFLEEEVPEAPSGAATSAFVKVLVSELHACRPATAGTARFGSGVQGGAAAGATSAAAGGLVLAAQPLSGAAASQGALEVPAADVAATLAALAAGDPGLVAAVARGVSSALKLAVARAETLILSTPSAYAVADHAAPTPAQTLNLGVVICLDEVRKALLRASLEFPDVPGLQAKLAALAAMLTASLPPAVQQAVREALGPAGATWGPETGVQRLVAIANAHRCQLLPFAHPLPAALALVDSASSLGHDDPLAMAVAGTAQGHLLSALQSIDRLVDGTVGKWLAGVAVPVERTILRLTEQTYTDFSTPVAASSAAGASAGGGAAEAVDSSPVLAAPVESEWLSSLETFLQRLSNSQLGLLPPGVVGQRVRTALASRAFSLFVRAACTVRPVDASGRLRLARDAAHLEAALSPVVQDPVALDRPFRELKAFRPLLFTSSQDLLSVFAPDTAQGAAAAEGAEAAKKPAALLRALRPANLLCAVLARLPAECPMPLGKPHEDAKTAPSIATHIEWVDMLVSSETSLLDLSTWFDPAAKPDAQEARPTAPYRRLFPSDSGLHAVDEDVLSAAKNALRSYLKRVSLQGPAAASAAEASAEYRLAMLHGDALLTMQ
jgi:hypothetical protein